MEYIVIIAILLFAFYYFKKKTRGKKTKRNSLRKEYSHRAGLSHASADEHIDAYIQHLQQKYPGRSEEWCLEKMLFDLERDRR